MRTSISAKTIPHKCDRYFDPMMAGTILLLSLMTPSPSTGYVILPVSFGGSRVGSLPQSMQQPGEKFMSNGGKADSFSSSSEEEEEEEDIDNDNDIDILELEPVLVADVRGRPAGVVIEDLDWRVEKLRLEEANTRRFLKSGPRFLPYGECKQWVQAWGERWKSAEEWNEWIAAGEKRNSYIPSRPEEYYTRTGDWISWEDFLGV